MGKSTEGRMHGWRGVLSMAAAFMGTVIGAGFASGQEIMQFFGDFGIDGVGGLLIAALGFFLYALLTMLLAQKLRTDDYLTLLNPSGAKWLNHAIDLVLLSCSMGVQTVMVAGGGALLQAEWGIPSLVGSLLLLALNGAACWKSSEGILRGFMISVPILILGSVCISIYGIAHPVAAPAAAFRPPNPMMGTWFTAAVLFVFHNMLSSIGVLAPLSCNVRRRRTLIGAGALGALCLGLLGLSLVLCIVQNYALLQDAPMPMLALSHAISPAIGYCYMLIMLCAIFSTTIGLTHSIYTRLANASWFSPGWRRQYILLMSLAALLLSRVGFVTLVGKLYPFFGYISVLAFCMMLYKYFRPGQKRRPGPHAQ